MKSHTHEFKLGDKLLKLETGILAGQANASVLATYGETVVLVTVVASKPREDIDWFPLGVEYQEKLYAGGIIKGSRWVKREGRPTDDAILTARLIDRSIRPIFPDGFKNEIQVIPTVLSVDNENDADIPSIIAASAALSISNIPFSGPIGAVRVGLLNKDSKPEFVINPTYEQLQVSSLDLVVSGLKDAIVMVEAGANEVDESQILKSFDLAQKAITTITQEIEKFAKVCGQKKFDYEPQVLDKDLKAKVKKDASKEIDSFISSIASLSRPDLSEIVDALFEKYEQKYSKANIKKALDTLVKESIRERTINKKVRLDGRKPADIRSISGSVNILPRTHGSALFNRGATQALTITTLGSPSLEQLIESMEGETTKRYIHHYHMPPYTVGETGRVGWPSRREIGHGALAERAIIPMIPSEDDFPYTIRVVSEIMSSNGSTSMASVCGSSLSLMDAGVPLKKPVSGIAMGLMTDGKTHVILSDILGQEDFTGDMDFKIAGTKDGITAMQMDVKIKGIPADVLTKALEQAKKGRLSIMDSMLKALPAPRKKLSTHAPRIKTTSIPPEKIGELIGPGGKVIKKLMADTETDISVNDDGKVYISGVTDEGMSKALKWIEGLAHEVQVGEEYDGTVMRLMNFGAFVEILPSKEGLVHVSKMSTEFVKDPKEVVKEGDKVHVRVHEIDDLGRINLTMLTPEQEEAARNNQRQNRGPRNDNHKFRPRRQFDNSNRAPHGTRRRRG